MTPFDRRVEADVSGSRFHREHAALMRPGTPADHAHRVAEAYDAVRDKWIAERRYLELVRAITANWTAGNCVTYMAPLSRALASAGERELHAHLWSRIIRRQADRFFHVLSALDARGARYLRLLNLDTDGFVETDPAAYRDAGRAAAFLLQRLTGDLMQWQAELQRAGWPTDLPDRIQRDLQALRRPRIAVARLPARAPTDAG